MSPNVPQPTHLGPSFKEALEKNYLVTAALIALTAFGAGWSTYDVHLNASGLVTIQKDTKARLEKFEAENEKLTAKLTDLQNQIKGYQEQPSVEIRSPKKGNSIRPELFVEGTFSGKLQNKSLWLFMRPHDSHSWFPQGSIVVNQDKSWQEKAYLPNPGKYDLSVVLVEPADHARYLKYLEDQEVLKQYPPVSLSSSATTLSSVDVVR